jgi:GNAT superfamily N-acetyltransferase
MSDEAEFLERAALEAIHQAAPAPLAERLGIRAFTTGSAFVSAVRGLPASAVVVNRTIGLGLDTPATTETVREIVAAYAQAGIARYFVHRHRDSAPAELPEWLRAAGLEKARGWQKFERGLEPPPGADSDLELRQVGREHGEDFARIVCDAFDLGEAAVPWLAEIPGRDDFHVFMSFAGAIPAGTGALFVRDGLAWFDFGATAPAFRRRGSQTALLARRVRHAVELGCRKMLTCTGEAVRGDPQYSYRNILKAGFRETSVRENYAPPRH